MSQTATLSLLTTRVAGLFPWTELVWRWEMGTPKITPGTESYQIIIPVNDLMPAGLSRSVLVVHECVSAVEAHLEGIRNGGLPRLTKSVCPCILSSFGEHLPGPRAGVVSISSFQPAQEPGPPEDSADVWQPLSLLEGSLLHPTQFPSS